HGGRIGPLQLERVNHVVHACSGRDVAGFEDPILVDVPVARVAEEAVRLEEANPSRLPVSARRREDRPVRDEAVPAWHGEGDANPRDRWPERPGDGGPSPGRSRAGLWARIQRA